MRKTRGLFITFEGTEGAGKSTLIRSLADRLRSAGHEVTLTREPGGNPVAEKIRQILLHEKMDPWTELFLYEAARAEHVARTIEPSLAEGQIVLCDRYADSSLAYQAHARGLPWAEVKRLNRVATRGLTPDLTVFMDIDPALGLSRANDRNRFEEEGVRFQSRVRLGFLRAKKESPKRWFLVKIRSSDGPEAIAERVWKELGKRYPRITKPRPASPASPTSPTSPTSNEKRESLTATLRGVL